jgi:NADPH-dependent curcumin reductase CurA
MTSTTTATTREIRLRSRPQGWPTPDNFELAETSMPVPGEGEVLVRNVYMSVDPYMRGRMTDAPSYVPPFQIGEALQGGAVGIVVESRAPELQPGDAVTSLLGWREHYVAPAGAVRKIDASRAPLSAFLGVLGMPGHTAYVGLFDVAQLRDGETVFVSAAAGAVGSLVGQLAKAHGCRVVGSAGSEEKVRWLLDEAGFDHAFNYRETSPREALRAGAPDGIDVYFDNVGGEHLRAAISALRVNGRIALCGMISVYNDERPTPGPDNLQLLIGKRGTMRGFIVFDHMARYHDFEEEVIRLMSEGKVKHLETVREGIENAPAAFLDLLQGEKIGKMLVRLGPDPTKPA